MPENRHIQGGKAFVNLIYKAVSEVSGAISTAMITTIVSFLPVFTMEAQEGKMFSPLAYTKTYALASAFVLGLILLPSVLVVLDKDPFKADTKNTELPVDRGRNRLTYYLWKYSGYRANGSRGE